MKPKKIDAILAIDSDAKVVVRNKTEVEWLDSNPNKITEEEIQAKWDLLLNEYNAQDYARKRKQEYPSLERLIVALYDASDKIEVDALRAEVKKKYPKP